LIRDCYSGLELTSDCQQGGGQAVPNSIGVTKPTKLQIAFLGMISLATISNGLFAFIKTATVLLPRSIILPTILILIGLNGLIVRQT
jgi:hypothetical protein